jgi:hypothetical protein
MPHILENENIALHLELPLEGYQFSRFDWTGKINSVKFQGQLLSTKENPDAVNEDILGQGFYNEFGIDSPLGFTEAKSGEWFHKIGVGLLKKESEHYLFSAPYKIKPAVFEVFIYPEKITLHCHGQKENGYGYILQKEIALNKSGFSVNYSLENTGEKDIITNEYTHNFIAFNQKLMGPNYTLKFPFTVNPVLFREKVNPQEKVAFSGREVQFKSQPKEPFFFSQLNGSQSVKANWELHHRKSKFSLSETGDFNTQKVNLWGNQHVVSPELFFEIALKPGQVVKWSRNYQVFSVD